MIVGAGLAGLIAAHAFPRSCILEAQAEPLSIHKALLRFRSPSVGELTGIEFKPVRVHKGIWLNGGFQTPDIRNANLYSQKVLGRLADRSIWNLDSVTRYIAPMDFYERLIDSVGHRIHWNTPFDAEKRATGNAVISTMPLNLLAAQHGIFSEEEFHRAPISVERYTIEGADVYQTIYFPTAKHSLYRASITGDLLICEFAGNPAGDWTAELFAAFGIHRDDKVTLIDSGIQNYGKIAPINEASRQSAITKLTTDHNIFSLGRFATWRNILLDDVVHDIAVIKQLINATNYERQLIPLKK